MKKTLLYLVFFLLLIGLVFLAPFIDGYLFRISYLKHIAVLQQEFNQDNDDAVLIKVDSYNLGWFKSTADLTLTTISAGYPSLVLNIKSTIHHGPLVFLDVSNGSTVEKKLKLVGATIESSLFLPKELSDFLPQKNGFMQINTDVSLNTRLWTSDYIVPTQSFEKYIKWDGLSGRLVIEVTDDKITKMHNKINFGKFYLVTSMLFPEVIIDPMQSISELERQPSLNSWDGSVNFEMPLVRMKWNDGSLLSINHFLANAKYGLKNQLYHYDSKASIDSIDLPPLSFFRNFSKLYMIISVQDVNLGDISLKKYKHMIMRSQLATSDPGNFIKMLVPSSKLVVNAGFDTEFGTLTASLNSSLLSMPKVINELPDKIAFDINVRVAKTLLEKIVVMDILESLGRSPVTQNNQQQLLKDPMKQAQAILDRFLQKGYIQQDKNDYIFILNIKGQSVVLNNKPITMNDLGNLQYNINREIYNEIMPPPPPVPVAPVQVTPVPAAPLAATPEKLPTVKTPAKTNGYCFWLNSSPEKNEWVLMQYDKATCYSLDSCNGGLKQSGGGCYKWAVSADAQPLPWDM